MKREQGFTELLLVPIGTPLSFLIDRTRDLNADKTGDLVYYPQKFDKANHGGKTKEELIEETGGWQIELIEDLPDLPAKGKGKEIKGRKQFDAGQSSAEYLTKMQTDPQYTNEQLSTPEAQLCYFMQYLQKHLR